MTTRRSTSSVEIIDERTTFTVEQICRSCAVDIEFVEALVEEGILEPVSRRATSWSFSATGMRRARIAVQLQRDLGVNLAGAALALDLLERIEELDARLRRGIGYS